MKDDDHYPNTSGSVLTSLKEQRDVTPHLPHYHLSLIPQQFDPRHRHLCRRFAVFKPIKFSVMANN